MPISAAAASIVGQGLDFVNSFLNRRSQKKQNEADKQFALDQQNRQRTWDVEDWNKTNAYNHPAEQMNRLRQAGLNPNLVYGKGADNTAVMIRGGATQPISKQEAPQLNYSAANAIMQYQNVKNVKAQTDNLQADVQLKQKESLVKDANIAKTMQDTATSEFQLEQSKALKDSVIQQAMLQNRSLETNMQLNINRDQREEMKNSAEVPNILRQTINAEFQHKLMELQYSTNVQEQRKREEEIKQLQIMQDNAKKDAELKQLDINLKKVGIQPGDKLYMRFLTQFLTGAVNGYNEVPPPTPQFINKTQSTAAKYQTKAYKKYMQSMK
jgi:hypothetical protein